MGDGSFIQMCSRVPVKSYRKFPQPADPVGKI